MSQFAAKDEKKDLKSVEIKLDIKAERVILLSEVDISKEDLREIHRNGTVCNFDALVQSDSNIVGVLEKFDVLILDIRSPENLKWYRLMRSAIEHRDDVNVVYLHQRGVPVTTKDHIKQNFAADYIVKELPKRGDYEGKADFFFKLLSDHIPLQRNWFAVAKNWLSCVLSCVSNEDEKQKN